MSDNDELPESKILEFEATIRRLVDENRMPSRARFEAVMDKVRRDLKAKLEEASQTQRRSETRD